MNRFASDDLKISLVRLNTWDVSREWLERGYFTQHYLTDEQFQGKINIYRQAMITGEWKNVQEFLEAWTFPESWSRTPLVFLKDGTLYEGKHRMAALATTDAPVSFDFLVITGWGEPLPMPDGWKYGWECRAGHDWWRFRKYLYDAVCEAWGRNFQDVDLKECGTALVPTHW